MKFVLGLSASLIQPSTGKIPHVLISTLAWVRNSGLNPMPGKDRWTQSLRTLFSWLQVWMVAELFVHDCSSAICSPKQSRSSSICSDLMIYRTMPQLWVIWALLLASHLAWWFCQELCRFSLCHRSVSVNETSEPTQSLGHASGVGPLFLDIPLFILNPHLCFGQSGFW
jgi:hypothetical protein